MAEHGISKKGLLTSRLPLQLHLLQFTTDTPERGPVPSTHDMPI